MPAPTALLRNPEKLAEEVAATDVQQGKFKSHSRTANQQLKANDTETFANAEAPLDLSTPLPLANFGDTPASPQQEEDTAMQVDTESRPTFAPEPAVQPSHRPETRKVPVPPHRMSPLKASWPKIYPPLVEHLKLQVRMNIKSKAVELRTSKHTTDNGAIQKGEDFVKAFTLGFDVDDAIALLRLDDLYIETFEVKDVKMLSGDHLSRAIGRIAGKDGKTKFAIENASKTRISLNGQTVHILGGFRNIHIAREAVMSLILGSPPSKVYGNLRTVSARMKERF